ncbi:hypothetical protein HQ584_03840 [Patescibacteria group bacterium]|nr:hypothetical protein [Patescibacteria group bacterium]
MIERIPAPGAYIFYLTTKFRKGFYESLASEIIEPQKRKFFTLRLMFFENHLFEQFPYPEGNLQKISVDD